MKIFLFLSLLSTALYSSTYAASVKEDYELQERCGKRAAELFEKYYGDGISSGMLSNYTCHYNKKLNKCFVLLKSTGYPKKEKGKRDLGYSTDKGLWDINENKQFGQFIILSKAPETMYCEVLEKKCRSENEWDAWVKPYMEE